MRKNDKNYTQEELETKVKQAYYNGQRDCLADTLLGIPFDREKIATYMLINAGHSVKEMSDLLKTKDEEDVYRDYMDVFEYCDAVFRTKEQMAMHRLSMAVEHGIDLVERMPLYRG